MDKNSSISKLVVRDFTPSQDYVMIQKWWEEHDSYAPKLDHLGINGKIIEYDELPICAGFLYNTDSSICIFEFPVCNPVIDKEIRDICIDELINVSRRWAKNRNYKLLYAPSNKIKFINRLQDNGFIKIDDNMTHMFCEIGV